MLAGVLLIGVEAVSEDMSKIRINEMAVLPPKISQTFEGTYLNF